MRIIKDRNGVVLTDQDKVKERWKEHFCDLYNPKINSDEKVLDKCPVGGRSAEVPAGVMREEIEAAINRLKKNRSPGIDNISALSAEELQAAGQTGHISNIQEDMGRGEISTDVETVDYSPTVQQKEKLCCDNCRGVSLLSHCGKVMTSVTLQRIRQRTEVADIQHARRCAHPEAVTSFFHGPSGDSETVRSLSLLPVPGIAYPRN